MGDVGKPVPQVEMKGEGRRGLRGWGGDPQRGRAAVAPWVCPHTWVWGNFVLIPNKRRAGESMTQRLSVSELATIFFG